MSDTPFCSSVKASLGDKYRPDTHDYVVIRHVQVIQKVSEGWTQVDAVEDATAVQGSTMVIMERPKAK